MDDFGIQIFRSDPEGFLDTLVREEGPFPELPPVERAHGFLAAIANRGKKGRAPVTTRHVETAVLNPHVPSLSISIQTIALFPASAAK